MDPNGVLATSAEIAVAIAGFSGIILAVSPNRLSELHDGTKIILSALILVTASTIAFSFVPLLMSAAALPERTIWTSASSLHAVYLTGIALYRIKQTRRLSREERPSGSFLLLPVLAMSALALQLANALWLCAAWPYLTSIVMLNVSGLAIFSNLLGRFASDAQQGAED